MVIAQAMAAGKPVIATPVGGVTEMVRDGETGFLVPVGDVTRLADALERVLGDPRLRMRMGSQARQFAEENYRAANVARKTREVYSAVKAKTWVAPR